MAIVDYTLVFVAGSEESQCLFCEWSDTQEGIRYLTSEKDGRDIYQVKDPMSFQVLLVQAAQVGCRVDLA